MFGLNTYLHAYPRRPYIIPRFLAYQALLGIVGKMLPALFMQFYPLTLGLILLERVAANNR